MKKNSFKRFLAVTLAAATALTFAPVSTLGLNSVVEAQAAETDPTFTFATDNTVTTTGNTTRTVDASAENKTVTITLAGLTANKSKYVVTGTTSSDTAGSPKALTVSPTKDIETTADATSKTIDVTVPQTTATYAPVTYSVSFKVANKEVTDKDGNKTYEYGDVQTVTIKDTNAARETLAAAKDTEFGNTSDTYYIEDKTDSTAKIEPSYVQSTDKLTYKDGSKLWYKILTGAEAPTDVKANNIPKEDTTSVAGLKITASEGNLVLTNTGAGTFNDANNVRLAAYEYDNNDGGYKLVGIKNISIKKHVNATYGLALDQSAYTMSLNTVDNTDALDKNVTVSKSNGEKMTSTEQANFLKNAKWTVSGDNIKVVDESGYTGTDAQKAKASEDDIKAKIKANGYGDRIFAVYSGLNKKFYANAAGSTTATVTITSTDGKIAQTTIKLTVIGTSQYVMKATFDGSATAAEIGKENSAGNGSDNPVILDVKTNNTYDLSKHIYTNVAMDLSYESSNTKNTVNASTGVVTATTEVDSFYVTVTGKINGNIVAITKVYFKVNALPFDNVVVTGKDKDQATTLNQIDYDAVMTNAGRIPTEQQLAASQIKYVQIEVTGDEEKQVTENLNIVSTGSAVVTAELADHDDAFEKVTNSGVITLKSKAKSGVAAIKLISAPSKNNVLTVSYIFVVVDKADAKITAPDAFKIGTCTTGGYTYNLNDAAVEHESEIKFGSYAGVTRVQPLDQDDDLLSTKTLYKDAKDINKNFVQRYNTTTDTRALSDKTVYVATAEGKTEKVLVTYNTGAGNTYQIISITSVPGVDNSITKIEDASTGKTIYSSDMGTVIPQIVIDGVTTLKVTLAYPIDKNNTTADIASNNMYQSGNGLNQSIMTATKETVKKGDTANTFYLYPTSNGTQVVWFTPSGDISETDHSIVHDLSQKLAVTYRANATPEKVTGLKVKNKKGAKVTVTFDAATNHNMKYWVQKKIGKKVSGKSVASNKTTLSVKKGATVKVRVKAYYYDNEGNKHVGKYSAWKTLKTDKK